MTVLAAPPRHVLLTTWRGADLARGTHLGTVVEDDELVFGETAGLLSYADPYADPGEAAGPASHEWVAWVSPEVALDFPATSVLPSWNATTPGDGWLRVEARTATGPAAARAWSAWFTLANWADHDGTIHPASVPGQGDPTTRVRTDVLDAADGTTWTAAQLRVSLVRPTGSGARPRLRMAALMASQVPDEAPAEVSPGGEAWGVELAVPAFSQQLDRGDYSHWDRGGRSWCSPTSVAMVLAFHDRLPAPETYAWVDPALPQPFVVLAARQVFDYAFHGAGNWSFNTAFAAQPGVHAFVTRLRSLTEAERFLAGGVPLVASVAFTADSLHGAGYGTDGHLLTVVGFTTEGDVVCNDPASHQRASNDEVRVVFDRGEFEQAWLGSSGGVVYVVQPVDVPLPPPACPSQPNW